MPENTPNKGKLGRNRQWIALIVYFVAACANYTALEFQEQVIRDIRDAKLELCEMSTNLECSREALDYYRRNKPNIVHYLVPFSYALHDIR